MERVNLILNNNKYIEYLNKNIQYEMDRKFCKHNMEHFLNMGRIAYILCLEQEISINKDIIYAVALLHDIGRWVQYDNGTPHEKASSEISKDILKESKFLDSEIDIILKGILNHRNKNAIGLNEIFYKADKLSRGCFSCPASSECNWSSEKKNLNILY